MDMEALKRQLDRIEADVRESKEDNKRCIRLLLGEDHPSKGAISRLERLEEYVEALKKERSGLKSWVGKILGGLIGAMAMLGIQRWFGGAGHSPH